MRTNIEIDDELMARAMKATGVRTKRQVVELGLQRLVQLEAQREILKYRGKLPWSGDLDAMRAD